MLTESELFEIEGRANAATEGPWHTAKRRAALIIAEDRARVADCHVGIGMDVAEAQINAEFVAHARADIPALCQTVRALRAENSVYKRAFETDAAFREPVVGEMNVLQVVKKLEQLATQLAAVTQERDALRESASLIAFQAHQIDEQVAASLINGFRTRAIQLCKDKAAEYESNMLSQDADHPGHLEYFSKRDAATELAQLLEQLQ